MFTDKNLMHLITKNLYHFINCLSKKKNENIFYGFLCNNLNIHFQSLIYRVYDPISAKFPGLFQIFPN